MNINKFTQKSMEAISECEKLAYEYGNQEIDQEHLVCALTNQQDGLIGKMIEKMEINVEHYKKRIADYLQKKPKVQGGELHISNDLNKVLVTAEDEAKAMGDEYVSVEHLFLCLIKYPNRAMKEFLANMASQESAF